MKVINSLFGAGQMMFTKYLAVVSGEVDIRNYRELILHILKNTDFQSDLFFSSGPLDVLDHSSDNFSYGGKLGIDGTVKMAEESPSQNRKSDGKVLPPERGMDIEVKTLSDAGIKFSHVSGIPVIVAGVDQASDPDSIVNLKKCLAEAEHENAQGLILAVDYNVLLEDITMVAWQVLANTDPGRDIVLLTGEKLFIDGTLKVFSRFLFPRKWPNVVYSSAETINKIDAEWDSLGLGPFIPSPSLKNSRLNYSDSDEVTRKRS
jgi:4-hydroxy-3-polyprenylbenzoate decarboxylase